MIDLTQLNEPQQAAVLCPKGPQLVVAGAGSGKTRVLTYKVAYLLSQGVPADHILALTFTNKAAREMKGRINSLVGEDTARQLWMGTFHSICARILRREAGVLGFNAVFSIYDTQDAKSLLKRVLKQKGLEDKLYPVNEVMRRISSVKNDLISPFQYAEDSALYREDCERNQPKIGEIYFAYTAQLKQANAMDFDDLLFHLNTLLSQYPKVRERWQKQFEYILVDEYQDTNYAQSCIVKVLAMPENNLFVVGDDAQSIYAFRGAKIGHILNFERQYPTATITRLEQNYRSSQNIVNIANSLIAKNPHQIPKHLFSHLEVGEKVHLNVFPDERAEAFGVANELMKRCRMGASYKDFAILYRTNAQSRVLEDACRQMGIPYYIYGGLSFYQRKIIKDALAYFTLSINPQHNESFLRAIRLGSYGIGETTLGKIEGLANEHQVSLFEVIAEPETYVLSVPATMKNRLAQFCALIQNFASLAESLDAFQFGETVLKETKLIRPNASLLDAEERDQQENLQELLNSLKELVEVRKDEGISFTPIADFLAEVSLLTDQDDRSKSDPNRISLMTVHAAKGLEFPYVFVTGMEEGLFPNSMAKTTDAIEEERRLFYVALTRAQKVCFLSNAKVRFRWGRLDYTMPSTFLKDLDDQYLDEPMGSRWAHSSPSPASVRTYFQPTPAPTPEPASLPTSLTSLGTHVGEKEQQDITCEFQVGERVRHSKFGEGTVLRTYLENENEKIEIRFDLSGTKTLLLRFARLAHL